MKAEMKSIQVEHCYKQAVDSVIHREIVSAGAN
jgi:hypothetical protein